MMNKAMNLWDFFMAFDNLLKYVFSYIFSA